MKTKILFHLFIIVSLFSSCQKDTDIFIPDNSTTGLDTNWVSLVTDVSPVSEVKRLLRKEIFIDSLDAAAGGTLQTTEGLIIRVPAKCLQHSNGQLATGKIHIEMLLIKQRGDMIRVDKPTTSFGKVLISGGEIFVRARSGSEELQLVPGRGIYIKYTDPAPSPLMKLFFGDESNPERFNWIPASTLSGTNNNDTLSSTSFGYELFSSRLRWINCDHFAEDTSGNRVNVTTSLPLDYTNANTSVYLVFKEIKSVVGMYGNVTLKRFISPKVPLGKVAVVVTITKKANNSYFLGHENITTGQTNLNGNQIVPLKPQPTSLSDIKGYLATL